MSSDRAYTYYYFPGGVNSANINHGVIPTPTHVAIDEFDCLNLSVSALNARTQVYMEYIHISVLPLLERKSDPA